MEYDFSVLNDRDFEILANDLLSQHFGKQISRFKPGKDKGVDGRWFSLSGEVIVQYKHWARSGVEKLITHMSGEELKKVSALSPSRYILATSVALSRDNKKKIMSALKKYILSEDDIFGREDLHDLLVKNPEVEKRNPKLWVATARVIGQIVNHGLVGRSGFALEEIQSFARRYAETTDACKARSILQKSRVLIIKGEPGVGKTTLAQALLLESVGSGYAPYVLNSIEEGEGVFDDNSAQFFLFDDFLGSNFLEVIQGKEDAKIVSFIRRILSKNNKFFVLTSRSHILEQGKDCSELFRLSNLSKREFELRVGHLPEIEKAKILYAHIWAGGMTDSAIDEIYDANRYMNVIRHRNFNPRLVSFITDADRVHGLADGEYWRYVVNSFERPSAIWDHVFRRQISQDARDLAYLVGFNGKPLLEQELKDAFRRYSARTSVSEASFAQRFHDSLKLSVGSVLNRTIDGFGGVSISLFNPSIGDYLLAEAPRLGVIPSLVKSLVTVASLRYLDSLTEQGVVSKAERVSILESIISPVGEASRVPNEALVGVIVRLRADGLESGALGMACKMAASLVHKGMGDSIDDGLDILASCFEEDPASLIGVVDELIIGVDEVLVSFKAMKNVCQIARIADAKFSGDRYTRVKDEIISVWQDNVSQFLSEDSVLDDLFYRKDFSVAENKVFDYISSEFESIGLDFDESIIEGIAEGVDLVDVMNGNMEAARDDWVDDSRERDWSGPTVDAEIHDYFERSSK